MSGLIDWVQLRKNTLIDTHRMELYNPSYWNKDSTFLKENQPHWAELTIKQLEQMSLSCELTVLEVGAGTGRITLPIAKKVQHITALEPSEKMLSALRENAKNQQVSNIYFVNKTLEQFEKSRSYDLVVASFSLFMLDIKSALLKMNELSSKAVYLFLSASPWIDADFQEAVFGNIRLWSDFVFIYNILHDLGILANVSISDYILKQSYVNFEDAISKYTQLYHIPVAKQEHLKKYLETKLFEENGKYWCTHKRKSATIWWTKDK
jgi:SAM-dependent methyltransferase